MIRGNSLPRLTFNEASAGPSSAPSTQKRLLLIDDIPNIQNYLVKEALHNALESFVNSENVCLHPLVIVISDLGARAESWYAESGLDWRARQQDTIDYRTVLPKSLQNSAYVTQIP